MSGGKPTILIVDDDPQLQKMLSEVLTLEGYPIEVAGNGKIAIDYLEQDPQETRVMLLDLMMPILDGYAVLRWMSEHPDTRGKTKIVIMSANERLGTVSDEQVEAKLAKPFGVDNLLKLL